MAFFSEHGVAVGDVDMSLATRLRQILIDARRVAAVPPGYKRWTDDMRSLRTKDGVDVARIVVVLDWLALHVRGQYTPLVYSAAAFRKKFAQLEAAVQAQARPVLAGVVVAEDTRAWVASWGYQWPANTQHEDVLAAVQLSIDNFCNMVDKLHVAADAEVGRMAGLELASRAGKHPRGLPDATYDICCLLSALGGCDMFVGAWWRRVHGIAASWPGWQGVTAGWAFHPQHAHFGVMLASWSMPHAGRRDYFAKLLERFDAY